MQGTSCQPRGFSWLSHHQLQVRNRRSMCRLMASGATGISGFPHSLPESFNCKPNSLAIAITFAISSQRPSLLSKHVTDPIQKSKQRSKPSLFVKPYPPSQPRQDSPHSFVTICRLGINTSHKTYYSIHFRPNQLTGDSLSADSRPSAADGPPRFPKAVSCRPSLNISLTTTWCSAESGSDARG